MSRKLVLLCLTSLCLLTGCSEKMIAGEVAVEASKEVTEVPANDETFFCVYPTKDSKFVLKLNPYLDDLTLSKEGQASFEYKHRAVTIRLLQATSLNLAVQELGVTDAKILDGDVGEKYISSNAKNLTGFIEEIMPELYFAFYVNVYKAFDLVDEIREELGAQATSRDISYKQIIPLTKYSFVVDSDVLEGISANEEVVKLRIRGTSLIIEAHLLDGSELARYEPYLNEPVKTTTRLYRQEPHLITYYEAYKDEDLTLWLQLNSMESLTRAEQDDILDIMSSHITLCK